jgi:hypothetical protein
MDTAHKKYFQWCAWCIEFQRRRGGWGLIGYPLLCPGTGLEQDVFCEDPESYFSANCTSMIFKAS